MNIERNEQIMLIFKNKIEFKMGGDYEHSKIVN